MRISIDPIADLTEILHGAFRGTITAICEQGKIVRWEVDEDVKIGHIMLPPAVRKNMDWLAGEIEAFLADGEHGFTGRLDLLCNDGAVTRYRRRRTLQSGTLTDLVE